MARIPKLRIFSKKELENILLHMQIEVPEGATRQDLFVKVLDEIKKPLPPPPPH
jgi:hypothetical protein